MPSSLSRLSPPQAQLIDDENMFDLAPVSLWVEDYTEVKRRFEQWRAAGITEIRDFLKEDPRRVRDCATRIRVDKVNRKTLKLFEADSLDHLVAHLDTVFRDDMLVTHLDELVKLWDGETEFFSQTVNYSLSGRRIDIQLNGSILPGYEDTWARVLVAIEDVTEREEARARLAVSDAYARGLFQHSPVSLWVEDFSAVRRLLEEVRHAGIEDFRTFTDVHPEFVARCASEIRVIDVNRQTLDTFGATSVSDIILHQHEIFREGALQPFREQLIDLWNGKLFQRREIVNYTLSGEEMHFLMQFSVFPGHERDWSFAQVALTDITARKKAEAYLEFLGKHDVLTKLYNRAFYVEELNRLGRGGVSPVTIIITDLNGLKITNDRLGHAAGDQMLRRVGEVLAAVVTKPGHACRIGGDEFAVILPGIDERGGEAIVANIEKIIDLNNQYYGNVALSLSIGTATARAGEALEDAAKRADAKMYEVKRAHHAGGAGTRPF